MRGNRLQALREARGLSQQELADQVGSSRQQIWRYESNKIDAPGDVVAQLAQFFGVTADYLLGVTEDPHGYQEVEPLTDMERRLLDAVRGRSLSEVFAVMSALYENEQKTIIVKK